MWRPQRSISSSFLTYSPKHVTRCCRKRRYSIVPTTLRVTSDLDTLVGSGGGGKVSSVHPFAALQIMDHHLHMSAILGEGGGPHYAHNWLCASQAVTSFPHPLLTEHIFQQKGVIESILWVSSIGKGSSITFGHALITTNDETATNKLCLATASRVFVRLNNDSTNAPAPFTEEERKVMHAVHKPDRDIIDLDNYPLPQIRKLEPPVSMPVEEPILKVKVGPQNVNFGRHVDHAFLFQTASHALSMVTPMPNNLQPTTVLASYKAPGELNQSLYCYAFDQQKICIYAATHDRMCKQTEDTSSSLLLLVAEKVVPTCNSPNETKQLPRSYL